MATSQIAWNKVLNARIEGYDLEIDPEIVSSNGLVYPQQKLYTFGFSLSF